MISITTDRYCVIAAPGCFGGNKSYVSSSHASFDAARKACRGNGRSCVIRADKAKGDTVWGDTIGQAFPILYHGRQG
jgi:hypothetical protein